MRSITVASLVLIAATAMPSEGQIIAVESTYNPGGLYYSIPMDSTYGWKFTVGDTPLSVSRLGFFDAGLDGLTDAHQIGIWDTGGNLITQATVPSGTGGSLVGAYRFELASPATLSANTTYHIGAHSPAPNDTAIMFEAPQTYASEITYLGASYAPVSGFAPPSTSYGASHGVFGPNLEFTPVPEPEHYALLFGFGLLGLACVRKKLRKQAA